MADVTTPTIRAPRGTTLSCRSWQQEAALRMLMNNLDPEVAERPDDLVVYGGTGRAARSWEAFDAIVATLRDLESDETLLVQSGKPVGVFRTTPDAPRLTSMDRCKLPRMPTVTISSIGSSSCARDTDGVPKAVPTATATATASGFLLKEDSCMPEVPPGS